MTNTVAKSADCLSRLRIDRWLNGELGDGAAERAHCASCARCAALVTAHRDERAAFAIPLAAPAIAREAPLRSRRTGWAIGTALLAAALCVWLIAPPPAPPHIVSFEAATREKGRPVLNLYVKRGERIHRGSDGERVYPGDSLGFTASTAEPRFIAIISIDGARTVSVYYPQAAAAAPLPAGRDQLLPFSVRLDGVLGRERLHGVFCDRAVAVEDLRAALAGNAAIPAGCTVDTIAIDKQAPS